MVPPPQEPRFLRQLQGRLTNALYAEAMALAVEARDYFDEAGRTERESLDPVVRVGFSCESLKVTTRLMHVIAWLLTQRAVQAGELRPVEALEPARRLGEAPVTEDALLAALPVRSRTLIAASADLYRRVAHLDRAHEEAAKATSPALSMQRRLSLSF